MRKLNEFKINNLSAKEREDWEKLIVYQQSRATALVHTGILICIPVIGWVILLGSIDVKMSDNNLWQNMRYYWWYKRMKNRYSRDFEPI